MKTRTEWIVTFINPIIASFHSTAISFAFFLWPAAFDARVHLCALFKWAMKEQQYGGLEVMERDRGDACTFGSTVFKKRFEYKGAKSRKPHNNKHHNVADRQNRPHNEHFGDYRDVAIPFN